VFQDNGHHVVEIKGALSNAELKETLPDFDGIVVRSGTTLSADVFPHCPNLKVRRASSARPVLAASAK